MTLTVAELTRPPALRPGDRVAVLACSAFPDQAQLDRGLLVLQAMGVTPVVYSSARPTQNLYGYLAGTDAERAADLTDALADDGIAAIIEACGGYGAQRTLELVDWTRLRRARPKHVVGFSDATAVLEAVAVRLGWTTMYGPMVALSSFETPQVSGALRRLLFEPEAVPQLTFPDAKELVAGRATGRIVGGCASIVGASLATATSLPARDAVLFVEDMEEADYRLDRIFTQYRRSGYLDGVRGVLAGTFLDCAEPPVIERLLMDRFGDLGVPILAWADVGHGLPLQTLPLGRPVELDTATRSVRFLDL